MFKPSGNPKIAELSKSCKERRINLSDLSAIVLDGKKICAWCGIRELRRNRRKWCSKGCTLCALAWAQPSSPYGLRVLLYKYDFKCAHCNLSYRSHFKDAYARIKNKTYFRFPRRKCDSIKYLIKVFRRLVPRNIRPEVDHIVSVAIGGQTLGFENVQLLCSGCHKKKSKKDTKERILLKGNPRKGVKFTDSHVAALSLARKGFDSPARKIHREKFYESIRIAIVATNIKTNEELEFISLSEASKALNLQESNISRVLKGDKNRKQHKGWTFRYK